MKTVLLLASAAFAMAVPAGSSTQQSEQPEQVVIASAHAPSVTHWAGMVGSKISNRMVYPRQIGRFATPEGTAAIEFNCGSDGRPKSVVLVRSSGDGHLDRSALRAIEGITGLHPLPAQLASGVTVRANLIYASDEATFARLQKDLRRDEARLAAQDRKAGRQLVVLDTGIRTQG